jgi:hypothetical protein
MDIAAFISELLAQQGILVVPGLGTFTMDRVGGYYNKEQQQFYPPAVQVQFNAEHVDDNVLAQMISEERQISVASAKYFIEKFVANIKDQAAVGTIAFGNMGTFSTRRAGLTFTNNDLNESDELFYGLAPVKLKRNSAFSQPPVVIPPPVEVPPVEIPPAPVEVTPEPVELYLPNTVEEETVAEEEYLEEEEEEEKRGVNVWLILAIIIVAIGASLIGVYKYKPELFDRFINKQDTVVKVSRTDSLKKAAQAKKVADSLEKAKADTMGVDTFRIVVGSFKTLKKANIEAANDSAKGLKPEIKYNLKNKHYEVNVGTYFNRDSADAKLPEIKPKFKNTDILVQTYPFKKQ